MTAPLASSFLLFLILSPFLISIATAAQHRAPHGLAYESPMAFPPSAFEFFHPKTITCPGSSPLPLAAQVQATPAQENKEQRSSHLGGGGIAGIVFGLAFAVLLAMAAYYAVAARRANMSQANSVRPDA